MTKSEAKEILRRARTLYGRGIHGQWKLAIRCAWMNGDYDHHGLGEMSVELQRVRNQFGPSFLASVRL